MRQIIKMLMKGSSSISIDGRDFVGRSVTINGDKVVIDGVEQAGSLTGPVSITLHGDADRDARIAELELLAAAISADCNDMANERNQLRAELDASKFCADVADDLRAELAAIKAQEPVTEVSEETFSSDGTSDIITHNLPIGTKLYAAPVAEPKSDDWVPSGGDYDRAIHHNPDAKSWADLFVATFPRLADKHDLMLGWFANSMMAMHDYLLAKPVAKQVVMPEALDRAFITGESCDGVYRVVIQSETLKEMQSVHNWIVRLNAADQ